MKRIMTTLFCAALMSSLATAPARAAQGADVRPGPDRGAGNSRPAADRVVDPDRVLPTGWRSSADVAWTTSGDSTGFHLLVAESRTGYAWRTVASLVEQGFDTDRWIGNVCFTGSGQRAVVVYAPRQFTNRENLFQRGAFAAIVNVASGKVIRLPFSVSLAYYNPGCGVGETAVLTQSGASSSGRTRLLVHDTVTGKEVGRHELPGQVTSAVPLGNEVAAAGAAGLVRIDRTGRQHTLAATNGAPFDVHPERGGGVAYLEAHGDTAVAKHAVAGQVREVARGPLHDMGLVAGANGRVFLTGRPADVGMLPASMTRVEAPADADVSSEGTVVVTHTTEENGRGTVAGRTERVHVRATVPSTRGSADFAFTPGKAADTTGRSTQSAPPPVEGPFGGTPSDPDATCAEPRNDPATQVYQPSWKQVEWAADLAVQHALTITRPTNWKDSGLASWSPQGMFPAPGIVTGTGRIPAPLLLGVLAQESNLWQASGHALEGEYGNPLVGNFYGRAVGPSTPGVDPWAIDWGEADCGYGVGQITDGMRWVDTSRTPAEKRAIALDYATNIAVAVRMLEEKYNLTWSSGIRVNSGNPKWIENWFAAVWAYNTGLQPRDASFGNPTGCTPSPTCHDGAGNWGLGWANNPINPDYPANRRPFMDGYGTAEPYRPDDARHPQDWPYPEKVMGWAAFPIVKADPWTGAYEAGYRQAWWTHEYFRYTVKPPRDLFCVPTVNHCNPNQSSACMLMDLHCWWNGQATYKPNCLGALPDEPSSSYVSCGQESIAYSPGAPEPADWEKWYDPDCVRPTLTTSAYIIDDVPTSVPSLRQTYKQGVTCAPKPFASSGQFSLRFAQDATTRYRSKIDFHQIGGGFGGHFWFAHTYQANRPDFRVTGIWRLNQPLNAWARVLVYIPDHGSGTQQARYEIDTGDGSFSHFRVINAKAHWKAQMGRWVPLGVFQFSGIPQVALSNVTRDGTGVHNITFDAIAIQPLPQKPAKFVVSLGDSFSSGEGATTNLATGIDYAYETDSDGDDPVSRSNCHRSWRAWTGSAVLKDDPQTSIRERARLFDPTLDYHQVACSGAQTEHLLPYSIANAWGETGADSRGEVSQLEAGFLDHNTTLVTLSIGGNDARWSGVIGQCLWPTDRDCNLTVLEGETQPLGQWVVDDILNKVAPSIQTVLRHIHYRAPNAKIILMGYPDLISNGGSCLHGVTIPTLTGEWQLGFTETETAWFSSMTDLLTSKGQQVADSLRFNEGIPVWFADARPHFNNQGVCGNPPTIHGPAFPLSPGEPTQCDPNEIPWCYGLTNPWWRLGLSQQAFHPNVAGALNYTTALNGALRHPEIDE